MSLFIFIIIIIASTIELFFISSTITFLKQKIDGKAIKLLLISSVVVAFTLWLGSRLGSVSRVWFDDKSTWFGSSVLFVLSLKYLYDGLRMKAIRKTINPLDNKGFVLLLLSPIINTLFTGVALGLFGVNATWFLYVIAICFTMSFAGVFIGVRLKKLIGIRYEVFISIVLLVCAIMIVTNA